MKHIIFTIILSLFAALPVMAQRTAKDVLDKTASTFRQAGGVEATFAIKITNAASTGHTMGTIRLKGDKFFLDVEDILTWYDGQTQWSYRNDADEVNISTPLEEELQSINPYAILNTYQQGYNYAMGSLKKHGGNSIHEVILTAKDTRQDITCITLYISTADYRPVYIIVEQRDGTRNEINITGYKTGLSFADSLFAFDASKYPNAEIIDLR